MARKISTSLAWVGVGIAVLCGLALSSIQVFLDYKDQRQRNVGLINNALHIASAGAAQAAYELSVTEAEASLQTLMVQEYILRAVITNEAGDVLSSIARDPDPAHSSFLLRALMTQDQTHAVDLFHVQGNLDVGELQVVVHTPTIMQGFFSRSARQLIAGVLRSLIAMAILLFVFNRMLTRPLIEFASLLKSVDPRAPRAVELPASIVATDNELNDLAMATNDILSASEDHITEIETKRRETMEVTAKLQHSERLSIVGKLTGGLAHDFNNILAVTMGSFELLQYGEQLDEEGQQVVETGLNASKQGASLTAQLLAYSRRQALNPKPIEIRHFFSNVEILLKQALSIKYEFSLSFGEGIWLCFADERQLETALLNLAINARDAMKADGLLTIDARNTLLDNDGNENVSGTFQFVRITVSDDGTGMSQEVMENVCEPYFTTKEVGQGSGLGLSMVHGFVNQSGGHIHIDSHEGQGTSVKIYLPRYDQGSLVIPDDGHIKEVGTSPLTGKTILIVEDNTAIQELLLKYLGYFQIQTLLASDASEALSIVNGPEHIDAALIDIILPGAMNGDQFAAELEVVRPGLPVVYMSGYKDDQVAPGSGNSDNSFVLNKPFNLSDVQLVLSGIFEYVG